jgi:hypothetical protein
MNKKIKNIFVLTMIGLTVTNSLAQVVSQGTTSSTSASTTASTTANTVSTNTSNISSQSSTQNTTTVSGGGAPSIPGLPALTVFTADNNTLISQGCNPDVLNQMNNNYINNRTLARNQSYNTLVLQPVLATPKRPSGANCIQQAMDNIMSMMNTIEAIISMFSGTPNWGSLTGILTKLALGLVCREVNNITSNITNQLKSPVTGLANTINGQVSSIASTGIGSTGYTVGQAVTATGNTVPTVSTSSTTSSTSTASNVASTVANTLSNINPFK